ncbi:MAG: hypothetical protein KGL02_07730 [Acidobacteriota bacterium]|nr:hypothetical protein [Acidobacteriota bacterium]
MTRNYQLGADENERLQRALAGCLVNPFVDDILDFNWEAIWHYAKGLRLPDPLSATREKKLHDAIDPRSKIGWSLKTQQIGSRIADCESYAVVIARADILGKAEALGFPDLSRESEPAELGDAVLKIWRTKVQSDRTFQRVRSSRVATLLKARERSHFAVHETDLVVYEDDQVEWAWGSKKGLWAIDRKSKKQVYRWYPSGGQLFEIFQVPRQILELKVHWKRLDADQVLMKLEELAGSLERLVDEEM